VATGPDAGEPAAEVLAQLISERLAAGNFGRRLTLLAATGWCAHPVRLAGDVTAVDRTTGEARRSYSSAAEPDNVLFTACGNRRASVCPSCAWTYAGDTFQLVAAGLRGGAKGVPESVAVHPRVFLTLTAPSFGPVHSRVLGASGQVKPCHPRDTAPCAHGFSLDCRMRHVSADPLVGKPLCESCFDTAGARRWNEAAPALWHRFTTYLPRELGRIRGITRSEVRAGVRPAYVKVAELQARGLIHFHAVIRADGPAGPESDPAAWCTAEVLAAAARAAAARVHLQGMRFGEQIDVHVVPPGDDRRIAAYIAKYASKGTAGDFADVGFAGHFSSKSRMYSTTLTALRETRARYRRGRHRDPWGRPHDDHAIELLPVLGYAGSGHLHPADAVIARTNARLAREQAAAVREARQRPDNDRA
jgi:hypothetical protein